MKRFAPLVAGLLLNVSAEAEPVPVRATPVPDFQRPGSQALMGPFEWRGGLRLQADDQRFGGLSGLALEAGCGQLLAVSDRGWWLSASLSYDHAGRLAAMAAAEMAPIRDAAGKPLATKSLSDAEALSPLGKGRYAVAFERRERVGLFDIGARGLAARFKLVPSPKMISEGPANGEMEAIGRLTSGPYKDHFIAISERQRDKAGNTYGWLWKDWKTIPFTIDRHDAFEITDLALLPDGKVLILERQFAAGALPAVAVRRFDPAAIAPWQPIRAELVMRASLPFDVVDNMEGIAVCERGGETRVTLVSDDNFNRRLQSTLLLQFAYRP